MNRGKVYSVSSVNQYIKNMFLREYALSVVFVKGEISNCKYHSSGHIYFSIKDETSQLTCVMFRGDCKGLDFRMENGQEVIVGGSISVYERDGKYQLYAKKIVLAGDGVLSERYEQLKKKLQQAGYFDEERKLPLPVYAKTVGIVTAETGAAIQDMINIAMRRNPYVQLILYPAKVQGEGAARTIVKGIQTLDEIGVDVIIIGRAAALWKICGRLTKRLWRMPYIAAAPLSFRLSGMKPTIRLQILWQTAVRQRRPRRQSLPSVTCAL